MKKINSFIKSRAFIIALALTFIFLIIIGVTYAWFTWTSTDNTNITMQIGEYTTVTYTGGNAINVNNLAPVYNYTDGESTTFTLTNNNTDVTKEFKYSVYLDITSISNELKSTSLKYVLLDGSNNIVDQGNFSTASNGSTLTITENKSLPNGNSSYTFLLYIDGNQSNNSNMMNKSLIGSLRVTVVRGDVVPNPITDFQYEIGTDDASGYVILREYIGQSPTVVVADRYTINDVTYDTAFYLQTEPMGEFLPVSTFSSNSTITGVVLPSNYTVYHYSQFGSSQGIINNQMISFAGCTSLVNAPAIPNTVTNMSQAFSGCTSLVNAPTISNSVVNMYYAFQNCTSLENVTEIPGSVINMTGTFYGCTNLTGTIRVNSSNVSLTANGNVSSQNPFYNTTLPITVEVPAGSKTYNHFTASGKPANVTVTTFTP